jgi:hypothetical protein
MRALIVLAALLGVGLVGCGNSLQSADPSLQITCTAEPNADPVCTQGSNIKVAPVHQGDDCGNGRKWLPISSYQADTGIMRCQSPAPPPTPTIATTVPPPVTTPETDARCTHVTTPGSAHFRIVSNGGLDCPTVAQTISDWSANCAADGSRCSVDGYTCRLDVTAGYITVCSNGATEIRFESD